MQSYKKGIDMNKNDYIQILIITIFVILLAIFWPENLFAAESANDVLSGLSGNYITTINGSVDTMITVSAAVATGVVTMLRGFSFPPLITGCSAIGIYKLILAWANNKAKVLDLEQLSQLSETLVNLSQYMV